MDSMHNLDTPVWSNDGQRVCYMGKQIRGADPKSFETLLGYYARDAKHVYFGPVACRKIERDTFRAIHPCFGADASSAYFCIAPIKQADVGSFRPLDSGLVRGVFTFGDQFLHAGYVADNKAVWFCSGNGVLRLKAADPKSFVSLGNRFGHDVGRVYFKNKILPGVDRATWRHWQDLLSVDQNSVFFAERKVEDVHRASIALLQHQDCFVDRNHIYIGGKRSSVDEYLKLLNYVEAHCAFERKQLGDGSLFQRLLSEWPQHV